MNEDVLLMNEDVLPNPRDLVFDEQFSSFQFQKLKVVGGGMVERVGYFGFERLVTFFEFRKMRFNRHVAGLLASDRYFTALDPINRPLPYSDFDRSKIPRCAWI